MNKSKGKTACIFLGVERMAHMKARAKKLGYDSFSEYICAIADAGLDLTPDDLRRLRALAIVKRKEVSDLVSDLVKSAIG